METISLRAARVNAGLRQSFVERKLGYSRSTLTRWETGKCIPRADALRALCQLYETPEETIRLKNGEG